MSRAFALVVSLTVGSVVVAQFTRPERMERSELTRRTIESLQLRDAQVVGIETDRFDDATLNVTVRIDGQDRVLFLEPSSVVAPDYKLIVQVGEDEYEEVGPSHVPLFRGHIVGLANSDVAVARVVGGLEGLIRFPDGSRLWIEPLAGRVTGAAGGDHVLYRDADVVAAESGCGLHDEVRLTEKSSEVEASGSTATGTVFVAQLAVDTDFEYFQSYGSVSAVEAQINKIINIVNVQYERDINVRHLITRIIVRANPSDPYSADTISGLINQVRSHWVGSQQSVPRDLVQMFTDQSFVNPFIGIAISNSLCLTDQAYSVVWSDGPSCGLIACKTDLSAHESGHVWSANHCSCSGWTMNPTIQSSNRFHPEFDIPGMIAFRNAKTCLGFMDKCLGTGTPDCNRNGVSDLCDVASQSSPDVDGNGAPDECQPPPMPWVENPPVFRNRSVGVISPTAPTLAPGARTALQLGMVQLYNPVPRPSVGPMPDFSAFQKGPSCTDSLGCGRWLGPPVTVMFNTDNPASGTYRLSRLQCTPYYMDWTTEGLVYVVGAEILPSSLYSIQSYLGLCEGQEDSCDAVSSDNQLLTTRYGDIAAPFSPPSSEFQPDGLDVVAVVDAFKRIPGAPNKPAAQLQPNLVDVHGDVDGLDITAVIDSFVGKHYPYAGPCSCPPSVPCDVTACTSNSACGGGLCIRGCQGGSDDGQPCRTHSNCLSGTCGAGFCRDRCGRCTP